MVKSKIYLFEMMNDCRLNQFNVCVLNFFSSRNNCSSCSTGDQYLFFFGDMVILQRNINSYTNL